MPNHWINDEDLVIEDKTLFRLIGWLDHNSNHIMKDEPRNSGRSPVYVQIAKWDEDDGWKD